MTTSGLEGFLGKLEVTNEIGEALDKQRQQAEDQAQQLLGGSAALKAGAAKVGELGVHVDRDLDEGKLQFENELAAVAYVKTYLRRAGEVLLNLAEKSKNEELVAHGRAAALRNSLEIVGRHCKSAKARAEQLVAQAEETEALAKGEPVESVEEGPRGARMPGERPGPSSLDERRAEARAAAAAQSVDEAPADLGEVAPAATEVDSQAKLPVEPPAEGPLVEQPPAPKPVVKRQVKKRTKKKAKTNRKPPPARVPAPQG